MAKKKKLKIVFLTECTAFNQPSHGEDVYYYTWRNQPKVEKYTLMQTRREQHIPTGTVTVASLSVYMRREARSVKCTLTQEC